MPTREIMSNNYEYLSLSARSTCLKALLILGIFTALAGAWSAYLQLDLLNRATTFGVTEAEAEANDRREQMCALLALVVHIATVVVFCMWIYRANGNMRALGARRLRYTPGWAVGFFFVPIVNLWKPCEAMNDLYRASEKIEGWRDRPSPGIVVIWWICWILNGILAQASTRLALRAEGIAQLKLSTDVNLVSNLFEIPLAVVALLLVHTIQMNQVKASDPSLDSDDGESNIVS